MSYEYSIDDLWKQSVEESREREAWVRKWLEREVYAKIQELRQGFDHLTYIEIRVQVPICMACTRGYLEESQLPPYDYVLGAAWKVAYRAFGFTHSEIRTVARALRDDNWSPRC